MCATNLWAVHSATYTPGFERFTGARIGVSPQVSSLRIASKRVRSNSIVFTLTRGTCDCETLIGRGDDPPVEGEVSAEDWLAWLRELPDHAPNITRLSVLRAWSPPDADIVSVRAKGMPISAINEQVLRAVRDNTLLAIDYPPAN